MDSVLSLTLSASRRHRSLCLPCCFHVLLPLWRTSSPPRWVFPGHSGNRCRFFFFLKEERFRSNTVPVPPPKKQNKTLLVIHFLQWLNKCYVWFFFLHLWHCQFYKNRWQRAQDCGAQLAWQNAMETFSAGSLSLNIAKQYTIWASISGQWLLIHF